MGKWNSDTVRPVRCLIFASNPRNLRPNQDAALAELDATHSRGTTQFAVAFRPSVVRRPSAQTVPASAIRQSERELLLDEEICASGARRRTNRQFQRAPTARWLDAPAYKIRVSVFRSIRLAIVCLQGKSEPFPVASIGEAFLLALTSPCPPARSEWSRPTAETGATAETETASCAPGSLDVAERSNRPRPDPDDSRGSKVRGRYRQAARVLCRERACDR